MSNVVSSVTIVVNYHTDIKDIHPFSTAFVDGTKLPTNATIEGSTTLEIQQRRYYLVSRSLVGDDHL